MTILKIDKVYKQNNIKLNALRFYLLFSLKNILINIFGVNTS